MHRLGYKTKATQIHLIYYTFPILVIWNNENDLSIAVEFQMNSFAILEFKIKTILEKESFETINIIICNSQKLELMAHS